MPDLVLTVSDCVALVNQTLEYAYPAVTVEGEIASFKVSKGKYVFFDIKDNDAALNCFMSVYQLRQPLADGMRVRLVAVPRLTAWGKFSLTVREVQPVGQGSIKQSFELLRTKLAGEGLFDAGRKRLLPAIPQRVGVIASVESAGYADFVKIINQRWGGLDLQIADVQVQGNSSAEQIIRALEYFNQQANPVEVVVVIRGGGSADDLAVFNDEPLVRAIAASRIPTLVGVGHEIDTSLCDLAADVRAATPSNAAQLLVPDKAALQQNLHHRQVHMARALQNRLEYVGRAVTQAPLQMLAQLQSQLRDVRRRTDYASTLLRQLDPQTVLRRGYSIVRADGRLVRQPNDAHPGQSLTIETAHAIINAGVQDVHSKESRTIA